MATANVAGSIGNNVLLAAGQTANQTANLTGIHSVGNGWAAVHLILAINISAYSAGDLAVTVSGVSASGYTWTMLNVASLASAATTVLQIGPDVTNAANATQSAILPSQVQVVAALTNTPNLTYGIDYYLGP